MVANTSKHRHGSGVEERVHRLHVLHLVVHDVSQANAIHRQRKRGKRSLYVRQRLLGKASDFGIVGHLRVSHRQQVEMVLVVGKLLQLEVIPVLVALQCLIKLVALRLEARGDGIVDKLSLGIAFHLIKSPVIGRDALEPVRNNDAAQRIALIVAHHTIKVIAGIGRGNHRSHRWRGVATSVTDSVGTAAAGGCEKGECHRKHRPHHA